MAKVMILRFDALSTCEAERDRLAKLGVAVEIKERWNEARELASGLTIPRQRGWDAWVLVLGAAWGVYRGLKAPWDA